MSVQGERSPTSSENLPGSLYTQEKPAPDIVALPSLSNSLHALPRATSMRQVTLHFRTYPRLDVHNGLEKVSVDFP